MQPQQDLDHSAQARKCPATSWTCRWKFQCKTYAGIHFRTPKESKRLEIGVVTESFLNQYEEIKLYIKKNGTQGITRSNFSHGFQTAILR